MVTKTYTITDDDFPQSKTAVTKLPCYDSRLCGGMFFDIETTGFIAEKNALYLIGCCRFENGVWQLTQWLAENESPKEQRRLLESFFEAAAAAPVLISYNGQTFDLPFIEKKCAALKLDSQLSRWEHWDLYKDIRSLRAFLEIENLKLKTVERFLGYDREDQYSGGELIPIYKSYTINHSPSLERLLLLHNYEDIKDMLFILPVLAYRQLLCGPWKLSRAQLSGGRLAVTLSFDQPLPKAPGNKEISVKTGGSDMADDDLLVTLHIDTGSMTLTVPEMTATLKYFFPNYKDYYYLPQEDYAIHKSVAAFVDKAFRQKATARNCYTKKAGVFLPQPEQIFSPAFKFQYKDDLSWFEYDPAAFSEENACAYIQSFLRFFNLGSF